MRISSYFVPLLGLTLAGIMLGWVHSPDNFARVSPNVTTSGATTAGSVDPDSVTARLFTETMDRARHEGLRSLPIGALMTHLGKGFVDRPYLGGMLDEPDTEKLICRLDAFDCVTFVEGMLGLSRGIKRGDYTYDGFTRHIKDQRYRGGTMDGYCSRLHYFTEWIADNEARGNVRNITAEIGGTHLPKRLNFMTEHRGSYRRIAEDDDMFDCIKEMEARVAAIEIYYIPQDRIRSIYDRLQPGDIIALATDIEGLDVTHTGLVYDSGNGRKGLMHSALSTGVTLSPDLQAYVEGNKRQIGIIVARPQEPTPAP